MRPDRRALRGGRPGSSATPAGAASETVLDLRGLRCPELVLRAKTALRSVPVGGTLVIECTDPLAVIDVPVFVHPLGTTDISRLKKYFLWNTVGQPYEEALAMMSLIYEGIMDDYPKLKICICHGGGYIPYYAGRSDHAYEGNGAHQQDHAKRKPSAYFKKFFFDTVIFDPDMLPYLVKKAGASQVMMGSDWPLVRTDAVGYVAKSRELPNAVKEQILWKNTAKLLKIPM